MAAFAEAVAKIGGPAAQAVWNADGSAEFQEGFSDYCKLHVQDADE